MFFWMNFDVEEEVVTNLDKDYLIWLLKEMQKKENPWNDELRYAVKLIQQQQDIPT
jgi:hypothetical protein|tara:strand:- start:432 stop:599 length:168 start_codon:yes stop_codon:yes gene_type:complete